MKEPESAGTTGGLATPLSIATPLPRITTIAPMPSSSRTDGMRGSQASPDTTSIAYACQSCVRRKVKCDRTTPVCSSCAKTRIGCVYVAPLPSRRTHKRKHAVDKRGQEHDGDLQARLARYETLLRDNGLLQEATRPTTHARTSRRRNSPPFPVTHPSSTQESPTSELDNASKTNTGRLISGDGKSLYVNSRIWLGAGEVDMRELAEHEHEQDEERYSPGTSMGLGPFPPDPLSGALLGISSSLLSCHPSYQDAMTLWTTYTTNVEPLIKILHIPTTASMVEAAAAQPATASRAEECMLFSIYHVAVLSLTDADCWRTFGQARGPLLARYRGATHRALVNAGWLRTTDLAVLRATVLLLVATRTAADPHTYWVLAGAAVRIAQRAGMHRDGAALGLPPFETEMRRRLWWQLVPLDGQAGQLAGTGISLAPDSWDTRPPSNVDDAQLHPRMGAEPAAPRTRGATEMVFCLARAELTNLFVRTGVRTRALGPTVCMRTRGELDRLVDEVEAAIEAKYLRYCDIGDPLHFLTLGIVRTATNTVRLHNRLESLSLSWSPSPSPLPPHRRHSGGVGVGDADDDGGDNKNNSSSSSSSSSNSSNSADAEQLRSLCALAHRILDTDAALHRSPQTRRFRWKLRSTFLWDALRCELAALAWRPPQTTTRRGPPLWSAAERDAAWARLAEFFAHHAGGGGGGEDDDDIVAGRGAIAAAVGRATLHAWHVNPPSSAVPGGDEPSFITVLRARAGKTAAASRRSGGGGDGGAPLESGGPDATPLLDEDIFDMIDTAGMRCESYSNASIGDSLFWDQPSFSRGFEFG